MLIQGNYQQAHKCLEDHQHPSDARYALYKVDCGPYSIFL